MRPRLAPTANCRISAVGTDTLIGLETTSLSSGSGNDFLDARGFTLGGVTLVGGSGNDVLLGSNGNDWRYGGDGDDTLTGESGADAFRSDPDGLDQLNTDAFDTVSADLFSDFPAWVDSL